MSFLFFLTERQACGWRVSAVHFRVISSKGVICLQCWNTRDNLKFSEARVRLVKASFEVWPESKRSLESPLVLHESPTLQQLASFQHLLPSVTSRLSFPLHMALLLMLILKFYFFCLSKIPKIYFFLLGLFLRIAQQRKRPKAMCGLTLDPFWWAGGLVGWPPVPPPACFCFPVLYDLWSSVFVCYAL